MHSTKIKPSDQPKLQNIKIDMHTCWLHDFNNRKHQVIYPKPFELTFFLTMNIKSKNNNILNIVSKIKLNQQNHNKQAKYRHERH
jgi:hypothetical protein